MSASFNFDMTQLLSTAADIFNGFAPIFLLVAGIPLGMGLLTRVVSEVRKAI